MSVTLKPVLLDHQWKDDGTNFYRIRVTHRRKSKFVKTNIIVCKEDLNRKGEVKTLSIKDKVDDLMRRMRNVTNDFDTFESASWTVDEVVRKIDAALQEEEEFKLDFYEYGNKVADSKSKGASNGYRVTMNALLRFFGRHPDISEITVSSLRAFERFLKEEKTIRKNWRTGEIKVTNKNKGSRAVYMYMSCIRHIYRTARLEFNEPDLNKYRITKDPFEYYHVPKAPAAQHRDIPHKLIQHMIATRKSLKGSQKIAIDAFLISFGLCGMNAVDMYNCPKPKKGIIHYCRQKTSKRRDDGAHMWVKVYPCIKKIMDEYKDDERCFNFHKRYTDIRSFNQALSLAFRKYVTDNKLEKFTFYSARHSWATIGRSKLCKVDKSVITAGLCHVDAGSRVDDIYIKFDWELLWDAQKVILDTFKWE
jgi:hypothetical protein